MKHTLIIALTVGLAAAFTSCDTNNANSHEQTKTGDTAAAHQHVYTCPMHPEVKSNEAGKCPKCSMELVHSDGASNGKIYRMDFNYAPAKLEAGQAATLHFMPVEDGKNDVSVPLDVVHEKKVHLIIVSKDLSYFDHVHPEYADDGHLIVNVLPASQAFANGTGHNETKFQYGGDYVMFADYTPTGSSHQVARIPVHVNGKEKATVKFEKENLTWSGNGYAVELRLDKDQLRTKESVGFTTHVTKNGKPVTDLDHYLGALGHMVVISEDTEDYLHVHPMDSDSHGPDVLFHTAFEKAGIYRVFLQFKHNDQVQTADFTVRVAEGAGGTASQTNHDQHNH
jgi:hypothetical protein